MKYEEKLGMVAQVLKKTFNHIFLFGHLEDRPYSCVAFVMRVL